VTRAGVVELSRGGRIAYDEVGAGPSVVLVHGLTEDRRAWDDLTPALAEDHRVVRIDLPSHGESSDLPRTDGVALARALGEVIRRLGLESPHLIGHSLGGLTVTLGASMFPAASVVNVDQVFFMGPFNALVREFEPRLRGPGFVDAMIEFMDRIGGDRLSPAVHRELCAYRARARQDFAMSLFAPLLTQGDREVATLLEPFLARIRCPYLALIGHDPGTEYRDWLRRTIPTSTVEIWEGTGHWLHRVEPERFAARVRRFLPCAP
jgi:pimeloyl-ACP methyl ester carboxylesterase